MFKKISTLILFIVISSSDSFAQTWTSFTVDNSGLPDNKVNSITVSSDNTIWFATDNGLASYKNGSWIVYDTGEGLSGNKLNFVAFLPFNSGNLWVATDNGATILNVDPTGLAGDPEYVNKNNQPIVSDTVTVVDIDSLSNNWIGTDKGLSIITDSGVYNFTEDNGLEETHINALKSFPDNWVHVATAGGGVGRLKYNGVDGMTSASQIVTTWSGLASDSVLTIYVTDDTLRWYGTTMGVSTHHGTDTKDINNWWIYNTFTSDIIDNYVRAIVRDNNGNMWFGTRKGLSKLSPDGSTWESFTVDDGLVGNNIFDVKVDDTNNIWVATDNGVSLYSESPSSVQNEHVTDYRIKMTNYPNPFNATTTIDYTIPNEGKVRLEVFDNLGRSVQVLVDESKSRGSYKIVFDTKDISSGVYFYRITTKRSSLTRKMVLLR